MADAMIQPSWNVCLVVQKLRKFLHEHACVLAKCYLYNILQWNNLSLWRNLLMLWHLFGRIPCNLKCEKMLPFFVCGGGEAHISYLTSWKNLVLVLMSNKDMMLWIPQYLCLFLCYCIPAHIAKHIRVSYTSVHICPYFGPYTILQQLIFTC